MRKIVSLLAASEAEVEQLLSERAPLTGHSCYPEALLYFRTHCFNWHSPTVSRRGSPHVWNPEAEFILSPGSHTGWTL